MIAIATSTWGLDAFYPDLRHTDPEAFEDLLGVLIGMGRVTRTAEDKCIAVVDVSTLV